MATKRGFSDAIKRNGPNELSGAQLRPNPGNTASRDVDALVSDFLEQLTTISSEIKQDPKPEKPDHEDDSGLPSAAVSGVTAMLQVPQKEEEVDSEISLREIEKELRESLDELENLEPSIPQVSVRSESTEGSPQKPGFEDQIPADNMEKAEGFLSAQRATSTKQHEQEQERPEPFGRSFSPPETASKKPINKIVLSASMIAILGIAGLYLLLKLEPWKNPSKPRTVTSNTALVDKVSPVAPPSSQSAPKVGEPAKEHPSSGKTETASSSRSRSSPLTDSYIKRLSETKSGPKEKRGAQSQTDSTNPPTTRQEVASSGGADQSGAPAARNTVPVPEAPPQAAPALNTATPQISRNPVNTAPVVSQPAPSSVAPNTTAVAPVGAAAGDSGLAMPPPPVSPKKPDEVKAPAESNAPNATNASYSTAVPAVCLTRVQPAYPELARSQNVSGRVEVEAEISDKGDVMRAKATSGPVLLRKAAEDAVMKWKFRPASVNGSNVTSKANIAVDFHVR